jgi:hypothetical protein
LVCRKQDQTSKHYHIGRWREARTTRLCQAKANGEKYSLARLSRGDAFYPRLTTPGNRAAPA